MRKAWIWIGVGAALSLIAFAIFAAGSSRPASVWTDGVRVCDGPGGRCVPGAQVGMSGVPVAPEKRQSVYVAHVASAADALSVSIQVGKWVPSNELLMAYNPVAGSDLIDASGVTWWRCDFPGK